MNSTCLFPLPESFEGAILVTQRRKQVSADLSSSITAKGRLSGKTLKIKRKGSALGCAYTIDAKVRNFASAQSPVLAQAVFDCAAGNCEAEYSGTLRKLEQ